jgi:hypothetical protein
MKLLERLWRRRLPQSTESKVATVATLASAISREDAQQVSGAVAIEAAELKHNIRKLEAKIAEREAARRRKRAELDELERRIRERERERERQARDVLCFLPSFRGEDYAQGVVADGFIRWDLAEAFEEVLALMEALRSLGEREFFLDRDHDFVSKMFYVDRVYYRPNEGIYVDGRWSKEGLHYRPLLKGVSPAGIPRSNKYPLSTTGEMIKRRQWEEVTRPTLASLPTHLSGTSLGCVCIFCEPQFSETHKLEGTVECYDII